MQKNIFLFVILQILGLPQVYAEVYQWTDENGQVHFGDRKPSAAKNIVNKTAEIKKQLHFEVDIELYDYKLPIDAESKIQVAVRKIYLNYIHELKVNFSKMPEFKILIFGTKEGFETYKEKISPGLNTSTGFFSHRYGQIVVAANKNVSKMLQVITHEANHAILSQRFSFVPTWLNEGLSEYYELMEVYGLVVVVPPSQYWERVIKEEALAKKIQPLAEYIALPYQDWHQQNSAHQYSISYAQGWSLAFFLMSSEQGKLTLSRLLNRLSNTGRGKFSSVDALNEYYPGGLVQLEHNWQQWIFSKKYAHRY